jgi:hypothetical protein
LLAATLIVEPPPFFHKMTTEFYIKYNDNQPVKIQTHIDNQRARREFPLLTVGHLVAACVSEPSVKGQLGISQQDYGPFTLHLPDGIERCALEDECYVTAEKNDTTLDTGCPLSALGFLGSKSKQPLIIKSKNAVQGIARRLTVVPVEIKSMAYGQADMVFIQETTGISEDIQVWEDIPLDDNVRPSEAFIALYKQNSSVFDFIQEAGRRTIIDLFLRDVVSLFPPLMVTREYRMKLTNEAKRRRLNGSCDYTICHRGHRKLPHLIVIEAKKTVQEALLQCIGECASIHYRRKEDSMRNKSVYGIHSNGSSWYFIFIDESGIVSQSAEFRLNVTHYVEAEVKKIYQLVYYVVNQSFHNSERTSPNASASSLIQ